MKISELPQEIKQKALDYQRNSTNYFANKESDCLSTAFSFSETTEGFNYWKKWHDEKKTNIKERKRPEHYKKGIDTFQRMESNCTKKEILSFCRGNIDKYTWRNKNQELEDFYKIIEYAKFAIKQIEK